MATDLENNHPNGETQWNGALDFYVLPEGCIANAVSLTSPRDACRLSLVASTFRSAAESDAVWESFLPSDYRDILSRSVDRSSLPAFKSKKELYLYLCDNPILLDGGDKSFSLEKWSGKKCFMVAARDLAIVWSDTPRYWRWSAVPDSRFPEVAELIDVCWLEIHGKINTNLLSTDTKYAAYLVFKSSAGTYGFEQQPAEVSVKISGGQGETRTVYLDMDGDRRRRIGNIVPRRIGFLNNRLAMALRAQANASRDNQQHQCPKQRDDGWMEIELGEYFNGGGGGDGELEMSLMEVRGGHWKSGLIIQGIEVRPIVG